MEARSGARPTQGDGRALRAVDRLHPARPAHRQRRVGRPASADSRMESRPRRTAAVHPRNPSGSDNAPQGLAMTTFADPAPTTVVTPARREEAPQPAAIDTHESLRLQVLEKVKAGKVDPRDADAVKRLIASTVDDYERDARQGFSLVPLANAARAKKRLERSLLEYGPLTPFLQEVPIAEEVLIKGGEISYFVDGRLQQVDDVVSEAEMTAHVQKLLAEAGATVDASDPVKTQQIHAGRARATVSIPPAAECLDVVIRFYVMRVEDF